MCQCKNVRSKISIDKKKMFADFFFWDNETENFQRSYLLHL